MSTRRPELAQSELIEELPAACANENVAVEFLERKRWGDSPCCVHCGSVAVYQMKDAKTGGRNKRFLWRCRDCEKQYSVRVGTIFEDSGIPLHRWCRAYWEAGTGDGSKSALEISRNLEISYKSALFLLHRIQFAATEDPINPPEHGDAVEPDGSPVAGSGHLGRTAKPSGIAADEHGVEPWIDAIAKAIRKAVATIPRREIKPRQSKKRPQEDVPRG